MNAKEFFDTVAKMRQAQREYLRTHSRSSLRRSIAIEKEVDAEINRVKTIMLYGDAEVNTPKN